MFLRLYEREVDSELKTKYLGNAKKYLDITLEIINSQKRKSKRNITFLCGNAGPIALGAVISHLQKEHTQSEQYKQILKGFLANALSDNSDELLYGRTGYLWSILFVIKYCGEDKELSEIVLTVVKYITENGKKIKSESPLMYEWHGKPYIGAAHGLAGILYVLLQIPQIQSDNSLLCTIQKAVDFLLKQSFKSGNYPTRVGGTSDDLVQWCHGAPALVFLFCKSYEVFKDSKYLTSAIAASDVVWKRGLLKKGLGLCHGISGNCYVFLHIYKLNSDIEFYLKALKICEFSWSKEGRSTLNTPDDPYSLMNGIAGAVCLYTDLLFCASDPRFPCFDL